MKKLLSGLFIGVILLSGCSLEGTSQLSQQSQTTQSSQTATNNSAYDKVVYFPEDKYPETGKHLEDAFAKGKSQICTIDREGADENRDESLDGIPTKTGYDRDEWPMAMCKEGGAGADIEYISPSDNRGAGSWVSHQLSDYPDGTRVKFIVIRGEERSK